MREFFILFFLTAIQTVNNGSNVNESCTPVQFHEALHNFETYCAEVQLEILTNIAGINQMI